MGYTDIVRHGFACQVYDPVGVPDFTQPAVVPIIPEPSTLTLLGIGSVAVMAAYAKRRQARSRASANPLS